MIGAIYGKDEEVAVGTLLAVVKSFKSCVIGAIYGKDEEVVVETLLAVVKSFLRTIGVMFGKGG